MQIHQRYLDYLFSDFASDLQIICKIALDSITLTQYTIIAIDYLVEITHAVHFEHGSGPVDHFEPWEN